MPPWVLHDLRRSFVTHLNENKFAPPHAIEAIVNHVSGHLAGVAGTYNKALYLEGAMRCGGVMGTARNHDGGRRRQSCAAARLPPWINR